MLFPVFPLLAGAPAETTPQDIPLPSATVLLLIFFALVFIVAWRLMANRSAAPVAHTDAHGDAHSDAQSDTRSDAPEALSVETHAQTLETVPDDLTIVEGIGPKIKQILNENGIYTFAELAETSPEFLGKLLRAHRLPNVPVTWPEQARLASLGDWDGLKTLQENLTAGRRA